jgi:hypothetical protein
MTPSGINPVTFRLVAQCLSHCATACPGKNHQQDVLFMNCMTVRNLTLGLSNRGKCRVRGDKQQLT